MKETKSMQIAPSEEQYMIAAYQAFGWELLSSQEIKTKDSHMERSGDTIYSVTESEHYIKLTFTRDDRMPYYADLKREQMKFETAYTSMEPVNFNMVTALICLVLLVFPLVLYIMNNNKKKQRNAERAQQMEDAIAAGRAIIRKAEEEAAA